MFAIIIYLALLGLLWLIFNQNKRIALAVLTLYIFMFVFMHFINQSDDTYSDVSHGLFGGWNVPLYGISLLAAIVLQLYVLIPMIRTSSKKKGLKSDSKPRQY